MENIDAVFVVGDGSRHENEELRYALRSLSLYCPFIRNVYIVGRCPKFIDRSRVKFIDWPDRFTHCKDANIIDKLRQACLHEGVSENFLFCSDDQFVTRECSYQDFFPRYLRTYDKNDAYYSRNTWTRNLQQTLEKEIDRRKTAKMTDTTVFYFQPHIWMPINRRKFLEYADWCDYENSSGVIVASGYFNFADVKPVKNTDHVFLSLKHNFVFRETHIAYNDAGYPFAMRILRYLFKDRSRFELNEAISEHSEIRVPDTSVVSHESGNDSVLSKKSQGRSKLKMLEQHMIMDAIDDSHFREQMPEFDMVCRKNDAYNAEKGGCSRCRRARRDNEIEIGFKKIASRLSNDRAKVLKTLLKVNEDTELLIDGIDTSSGTLIHTTI